MKYPVIQLFTAAMFTPPSASVNDVYEWCDTMFPNEWTVMTFDSHNFTHDDLEDGTDHYRSTCHYFMFDDPKNAALFKLTFGGV